MSSDETWQEKISLISLAPNERKNVLLKGSNGLNPKLLESFLDRETLGNH